MYNRCADLQEELEAALAPHDSVVDFQYGKPNNASAGRLAQNKASASRPRPQASPWCCACLCKLHACILKQAGACPALPARTLNKAAVALLVPWAACQAPLCAQVGRTHRDVFVNLMVAGESGQGKTTCIENLFAAYHPGVKFDVHDGSATSVQAGPESQAPGPAGQKLGRRLCASQAGWPAGCAAQALAQLR